MKRWKTLRDMTWCHVNTASFRVRL